MAGTVTWGTHLPSLPLDLGGLGNRIPTLVDVELLGEDFVVEVGILIKELEEEEGRVSRVGGDSPELTWSTHKLYSVTRLDVLKLGDLHLGQVVKRLLVLLPQQG